MAEAPDFADSSGGIDAPGSGWGGSSGRSDSQNLADFDNARSAASGKPGETNMAQAESQTLGSVANQPGYGQTEGFNPNNPTQTVDQLNAASNVNQALSFGLPMAASMLAPGWGTAMMVGKTGAKLMNGTPVEEVVSDILPGYINGKINQATGGILGKATMAGNALNWATDSPKVPNIGQGIVNGILGRQSGNQSGGNYAAAPGASARSEGNGDSAGGPVAVQAGAPPSKSADVDFASLGIDSAGWTAAAKKYTEAKNV